MHSKKYFQSLPKDFGHNLLSAKNPVSLEKTCQVITQIANNLVFLPEEQWDLHDYGLMPMLALSPAEQVNQAIQVSIPILYGKTLQWSLNLATVSKPVSVISVKLGTGNRVNHCQLVLSIFAKQPDSITLVASAHFDGTMAQNNQWADLGLDHPLWPGQYFCQLTSPDADNQDNTLFLWLTTERAFLPDNLIDLYDYGLAPVMTLLPYPKFDPIVIITKFPLLPGKILQWQMDFAITGVSVSTVFLKLGTGGRMNQCQLVLSLFAQQSDKLDLVAIAKRKGNTVRDGQWTQFVLDRPLLPGQYICQLQSPDADSAKSVIFVWLTAETIENTETYCYVSPQATTLQTELAQLKPLPVISVMVSVPVDDEAINNNHFMDCLNSVVTQVYPHWELCLVTVTDNPNNTLVEEYQHRFPHQIKLAYISPEQSIANRYNTALELATGEYTVFLYSDDLLGENALFEIVTWMNQTTETVDLLYSDEDELTQNGWFVKPYFKPAWAPELLKGQMYIGQLAVYRTLLLKQIGGFRETLQLQPFLEWAAKQLKGQIHTGQLGKFLKNINVFHKELYEQYLWDLVLRLTEQTRLIQHIPKILYHRRRHLPVFTTSQTNTLTIVQEALDREGQGGYVTPRAEWENQISTENQASLRNLVFFHHRTNILLLSTTFTSKTLKLKTSLVHYPVQGQPLVSIIIPTKDMASMLAHCIDAIRTMTTYPHWEIIVVDNGSTEVSTLALFDKYQAELGNAFTVSQYDIPFNFSKLVNHGVNLAKGEIILLLNNDTEIFGSPNWLQEMIGFAQHPEIACVGCKLLYPQDNTIQHAGLICGVAGVANHGHKHFPANSPGYFNRLAVVANYSAITGACLMVRRALWEQVNGFDDNLAIAYNDVDFCLKLLKKGFRHVVLPQVTFYHHESKTRGSENTSAKKKRLSEEENYMKQRWESFVKHDPFYNPHLTQYSEDFSLSPKSFYHCEPHQKKWQTWLAWFKKFVPFIQ